MLGSIHKYRRIKVLLTFEKRLPSVEYREEDHDDPLKRQVILRNRV